jgi:hypothetical protein
MDNTELYDILYSLYKKRERLEHLKWDVKDLEYQIEQISKNLFFKVDNDKTLTVGDFVLHIRSDGASDYSSRIFLDIPESLEPKNGST